MNDFFDRVCTTPLRCFLFIFISTYLLWWLVLGGPEKWDNYFGEKIQNNKELPIFIESPFNNLGKE